MSNPLAIFRKYQKILLVVFGVLLIMTFTVGGIVSQYLSTSAAATNNPVVVEMKTGDLRESDLHHLRVTRHYLRQFMRYINMQAAQAGATPRQTLGIPDTNNEENLLQTAILAERAKKVGMEITDQAILNFLDLYTASTIPRAEYPILLRDATQSRMAPNQFFNAMRRELMVLQYVRLFECGMLAPTPETAWNFYQRLNRRISFEAVPLAVNDFLAQVDTPSDAEIEAVYEEGKDRDPVPSRAEPGFKQMKQVAIQYVKADLSQFLPAAASQITQEQIETFYNANKEEYRNLKFPMQGDEFSIPNTAPETPETTPAETPETAPAETSEAAPAETPEATPAETPETPATDDPGSAAESPETNDADTNTESLDEANDGTPEPEDQSQQFSLTQTLLTGQTDNGPDATDEVEVADAVVETTEEPADQDTETTESDESVAETPASPVEETVVETTEESVNQEDNAETTASDASATETPDPPAAETVVEETTTAEPTTEAEIDTTVEFDATVTDTNDADDPLADLPDTPDANAAVNELLDDADDADDADDPLADLPDAPGSNEPEFKPLAEVEDEIRMRLASPIAREAMNEAVNAVRRDMKSFLSEYRAWYLSADRDTTPAPNPPNLRPAAQQLGLTFNAVPLVNMYELLQTDPTTGTPIYEISRAYATAPVFQGFYQIAFQDDLRLFQPETIRGQVVDTEYLFWKVDEKEARIPELDEIRDEVVRAAKHAKALELAKQSADEMVESLRTSGQRPSDAYRNDPNRKVIVSPSMSWMTANVPGAPPRLTSVPGIEYAGQDFMKSVFALNVNQYGTAVDQPQKNVYAVMVTSVDTQEDELRTQFVRSFASYPANETGYLVRQAVQQYARDWYLSIEDDLGVDWKRDPAAPTR